MTRYTLLNDALARGQIAGSRAAKAGLGRGVPPGCYKACLGVYAGDPDVRVQFQRGFALGYDTTAGPRTGWAISDDVKEMARDAALEVKPSAPPPSPTATFTTMPVASPKPAAPSYQAPIKAGVFGLSRNASIALGVGAAAAIVGGVYFATRDEPAAPMAGRP
jgi:hypothetical protein